MKNDALLEPLKKANAAFAVDYPGESPNRQPVSVVYGGAQMFHSKSAHQLRDLALENFEKYAATPEKLMRAVGAKDSALWKKIHDRVKDKLQKEAVEDYRIDFEDGYGIRPDAEEDGHVVAAAEAVAKGMAEKTLPPFIGIRIKPFNNENLPRATRTLDLFVTTLLSKSGGKLPGNFVVTLPKVTIAEQCSTLAKMLAALEAEHHLASKSLRFELMIETPQSVLDREGRCPIKSFVRAGEGRCIGAHFGTYDYTAGCNITAAHQSMTNPVCDFAKDMMKVSLAGMPVFLSDGATNIMPIGDEATVHRAWRISHSHIRHSLETGFYQGWDLHPAQLPIRYATVYEFFLESAEAASNRLKTFVEKAAKATLLGDVFDDAATGQGLLNFFLRGVSCGAISEAEAAGTGLTQEEFRSRSFLKILEGRKM